MKAQSFAGGRADPALQRMRIRNAVGIKLDPPFDFLRTLWLLNHRLETASKQMMSTIGVTGPQRMILRIVGRNPGVGAGSLAQLLHVNPGTLSSALKRLEGNGLLVRKADPRDRRRILIALTREGRALDKPMPRTVENGVRTALQRMSGADVARTQRVLLELAENLELEMNGM